MDSNGLVRERSRRLMSCLRMMRSNGYQMIPAFNICQRSYPCVGLKDTYILYPHYPTLRPLKPSARRLSKRSLPRTMQWSVIELLEYEVADGGK